MKKTLLLLLLTLAGMTANAQIIKGDMNGDGKITMADVNQLMNLYLTQKDEPEENDPEQQTVTGDATNVKNTSAVLTCYANNILDNLSTDLKAGVIYCTDGTPTKSNGTQKTISISSIAEDGKYTLTLTGLTAGTTYNYRSFVYQSGLWFYGKVKNFTTMGTMSFSSSASNITCFSSKVTATYIVGEPDAVGRIAGYGIYYGTTSEPSTQMSASNADGNGKYTVTLRALTGGTVYYYRPYAVMDGKTFLGEVNSFQTKKDNVVTTGDMAEDGSVRSTLTIGGGAYSTLNVGLCWSQTNTTPTVSDSYATTTELDDENCYTITPSFNYGFYRAFVQIDGVAHYGETKELKFIDHSGSIGGREYVDLGLPSGTLWATCNVGAKKPEDYGRYFAWGEIKGYTSNTSVGRSFDWASYKWCNGSFTTMTKYCTDSYYGTVDNKTELEAADDAATVNWGKDWQMPSFDQIKELYNSSYTTTTWTTVSGVYGRKITSKTNGNTVFLPAAGYRYGSYLGYAGSRGGYRSRSLYTDYSSNAYNLDFNSSSIGWSYDIRSYGRSVRPVRVQE